MSDFLIHPAKNSSGEPKIVFVKQGSPISSPFKHLKISIADLDLEATKGPLLTKMQQIHMKYTQTIKKRGGRQISDLREKWKKGNVSSPIFFTESLRMRLFLWDTVHQAEDSNRELSKENRYLKTELKKVKGTYKRGAIGPPRPRF